MKAGGHEYPNTDCGRSLDGDEERRAYLTVWAKCQEKRREYVIWKEKCRELQREYERWARECEVKQRETARLLAECEAIKEYIDTFRDQELQ